MRDKGYRTNKQILLKRMDAILFQAKNSICHRFNASINVKNQEIFLNLEEILGW